MRTELKLPPLSSLHDILGYNPITKQKYKLPHYRKWLGQAKAMLGAQTHHHHRHAGKVKMTLIASKEEYTEETIYILETAALELLVEQRIITAWEQVKYNRIEWCGDLQGSIILLEDIA